MREEYAIADLGFYRLYPHVHMCTHAYAHTYTAHKRNESEIVKIVAYAAKGAVYPPCGVCREMIRMVNEKNLEAEVMVGDNKIVKVKDLLPDIFISKSTE